MIPLEFRQPLQPPPAEGVWLDAVGVQWALERTPDFKHRVTTWRGCACGSRVFISAPLDELPWAPNAHYLARHASGALWLPVLSESVLPVDWVATALGKLTGSSSPLLCLPDEQLVISLEALGPIDSESLRTWLSAQEAA